ncbi:hypothetical protein [Trichormus azollae]|mgnify:FL=1|uniref:hypothetical protein n=1 Tax=Trichormus azollae TaxID=1164 RepID=UPI0001956FAE|nr:hypothetical protein [Trichormus azollae]
MSDISLFREKQEKSHNNQMFEGDKVYQGGKNISTPYKKPRKGELTSNSSATDSEQRVLQSFPLNQQ